MTLIDDHSRYTTVYFLNRKSEAADRIEEYVEMVHTRFGKYPTAIRSDQGGEYKSKRLGRFYRSKGITPQFTAAYTPQQNGVAERKNRSLVEMGRCMLLDSGMGYRYWAEAINTAAYLQNLLPTRSTKRTPWEAWYGKKPNLNHLKMFGTPAYVHIPSEKRTKLEPKAVKMTFVGYSNYHKAYRFIDLVSDKVVYSRDARFLESEKPIKLSTSPADVIEIESHLPRDIHADVAPADQAEEQDFESADEFESGEESLEDDPATPIRTSNRSTKGILPARYRETSSLVHNLPSEPRTYNEAINGPESVQWKAAIEEELDSLRTNGTWELTDLPADRKAIGSKWIFKRKQDEYGNVVRYKARLVAQGFTQKYGTDFDEVFAPVVKQVTFRVLLSVANQKKMIVKHADVKTAYLHGVLDETVYMRMPTGSTTMDNGKVCLLRKSLYGLKQSARVWNQTFDAVLKKMRFVQSKNDSCLYVRRTGQNCTYLVVYVDDLVIACEEEEEFEQIIRELNQHFEVTSLGDIKYFLGIEVNRSPDGVSLNQTTYIQKLLDRFGMTDAKPSKFPISPGHTQSKEETDDNKLANNKQFASLIGGLLYVAVNTRPDIAAAVSILGRKTSCPTQADWLEAKRILRYLKHTMHDELLLGVDQSALQIYVDADWAGDTNDRKSTSGFLFRFGGGSISWSSKKQNCVTLSSTEAEYVALAECLQEFRWVYRILGDFDVKLSCPVDVFEDNQGVIKQTNSPTISRRSKHIETKYHFVRDLLHNGEINLRYCPTDSMVADMMTKPLQSVKLKGFREAAGVLPSRRSVGDDDVRRSIP